MIFVNLSETFSMCRAQRPLKIVIISVPVAVVWNLQIFKEKSATK